MLTEFKHQCPLNSEVTIDAKEIFFQFYVIERERFSRSMSENLYGVNF